MGMVQLFTADSTMATAHCLTVLRRFSGLIRHLQFYFTQLGVNSREEMLSTDHVLPTESMKPTQVQERANREAEL